MKKLVYLLAMLVAFACGAEAQAPVGSTGICKDGMYTSAADRDGACRGHKGVKSWFATPVAASTSAAVSPPAVAAKPSPRLGPGAAADARVQAPGGGPGLVWVNTATQVYHCPGTRFYGKTKAGEYMSEADAKAKGAHGVRGAGCATSPGR